MSGMPVVPRVDSELERRRFLYVLSEALERFTVSARFLNVSEFSFEPNTPKHGLRVPLILSSGIWTNTARTCWITQVSSLE